MAAGLAERPHRQIAGANDARPREARPGARQRRRVADHARMIIGESLLESLLVPVTSLPSPSFRQAVFTISDGRDRAEAMEIKVR